MDADEELAAFEISGLDIFEILFLSFGLDVGPDIAQGCLVQPQDTRTIPRFITPDL